MNKFGFLVAGGLLSLGAFAADEGVTLGGYVDAGFTTIMQDEVAGGTVSDPNGFLVREGAVWVGKKWTEWEVLGDFGFKQGLAGAAFDMGDDGVADGAGGGDFGLFVSQAYVSNWMDNGFNWKVGKFDGLFGFYSGRFDSFAHMLTDTGYIQGAYLPRSHTGLMVGYSFSDMLKVSALAANDNEVGPSKGGATSGTRHPDFGVDVSADFDTFNANLGAYFMGGETTPTAGNESKMGYTISAVLEGKLNPIDIGVYGTYFMDDEEDAEGQFGVGANFGWMANDNWGLTLRGEYVSSKETTQIYNPVTGVWTALPVTEVTSIIAGTLGGHWKFNDAVRAKVDYSLVNIDADGGDVDPVHIVQAGVVANF